MWTRRDLLAAPAASLLTDSAQAAPAALIPEAVTRTWICPQMWANRLADWRIRDGWVECLDASELRTAMLLTRECKAGPGEVHLRVRIRRDPGLLGFAGFLIGGGSGQLDWRAAALMLPPSGANGGFFAVMSADGTLEFREHTNEERPLAYARIPSVTAQTPPALELELRLDIRPGAKAGTYDVSLSAGRSTAIRRAVPEAEILGSIGLVCYGATAAFRDFTAEGSKLLVEESRATGPILGALHSLNGRTLKLTAQLFPVEAAANEARLEIRGAGEAWRFAAAVPIDPGYTARFRLPDWDSTRDWEYRITAAGGSYSGKIRKEPPAGETLVVGLFSCHMPMARNGRDTKPQEFPDGEYLGRYTHKCIYFPHAPVIEAAASHKPHLLLFTGDQIYQNVPTPADPSDNPRLDYLYKWYLWVWAFRDLARDTPAIVLVDDHDVYHGNIWGEGGRMAPDKDQNQGGYVRSAEFVNLVQRTQTSHNPDPFDPTPVDQNIGVYYGAFEYGGASFAVLEDRKFKVARPSARRRNPPSVLLGARQERFLEQWAQDRTKPKICVTQTVWACAHTTETGAPAQDYDANGYPKAGRDRAIRLLKKAGALLLSGDQHLGMLIRHGLDTFTDGIVQFSAPSTGTSFQRWFEPAGRASPTGNATDFFGNRFRMLAVANPPVSFAAFRKVKPRGNGLADKTKKRDGFGIVRVDYKQKRFVLECWDDRGTAQHPGWPYTLPFNQT
ncbi:MAG: alkaline phosphatase D family protein [Bryobacteraceae bacterium]